MVSVFTAALFLLSVAATAATATATTTTSPQSLSLDLEAQPPRPAAPGSHRGFPSHITVFDPVPIPLRHRLSHSLRRCLSRLSSSLSQPSSSSSSPSTSASHLPTTFTSRSVAVDLLGGITKVGEYYTRVFMGGQPVRVQVDTGSSTFALPVAECKDCRATDQRYNPRLSTSKHKRWIMCTNALCKKDVCAAHQCGKCSSSGACCAEEKPSVCGFRLRYGDGSNLRGGLMVEEMRWGENVSAPVVFGAILHDSPDFERPLVDGILGMAYRALACNPSCVEPPFQQMVAAGVVGDAFSICITPSGGKLVLGDFDQRLATSKPAYVPLALSDPPSFYTVNMANVVTIGGRNVAVPNMRAGIVDSGTTLLVVKITTFRLLLQQLTEFYCDIPGLCHTRRPWFMPTACVKLSDDVVAKLPTLEFHLGTGAEKFTLKLRPQDYMLHMSDPRHAGYRCVGIMVSKTMGARTDVIFGNTVMMRYTSHYDRKNKRVGFAEAAAGCGGAADCASYTQCRECATAKGCRWNFADGVCTSGGSSAFGLVPYPECAGQRCFCRLGGMNGLVFGLGAGAGGALVIVLVAVLIIVLYSRRAGAAARRAGPRSGEEEREWFQVGTEDDEERAREAGVIPPEKQALGYVPSE